MEEIMNTDDEKIESLSKEQLAERLRKNREEQTDDTDDEYIMCYDIGPPDDWSVPEDE